MIDLVEPQPFWFKQLTQTASATALQSKKNTEPQRSERVKVYRLDADFSILRERGRETVETERERMNRLAGEKLGEQNGAKKERKKNLSP